MRINFGRHLLFEEKNENIMEPIFQDLYQKNTKSDAGKSEFFNEGLVIDLQKIGALEEHLYL